MAPPFGFVIHHCQLGTVHCSLFLSQRVCFDAVDRLQTLGKLIGRRDGSLIGFVGKAKEQGTLSLPGQRQSATNEP